MYENFGATVTGSSVTFSLFFPDNTIDPTQYRSGGSPLIKTLKVTGSFLSAIGGVDWDADEAPELVKNSHPSGWLYSLTIPHLADGFYEYKYYVEFENGSTRWCSDPCSKYGGVENENSGFVVGGNDTEVIPIKKRLPLQHLIIYELMLDDFTAEYRNGQAPIDAVLEKLDYLQDLGINAIEFMPWTTWPQDEVNNFSWGYDPVSFFSVEYRYYNVDTEPLDKLYRLKKLINEIHVRDIHVIMDGVFNHAKADGDPDGGFAYYRLYQNPADSPYIGNFAGVGYFNELNFANNCTDQFIIDVCKYWIQQYRIDGIRFDYVLGYYEADNPNVGINEIILYLMQFTEASGIENFTYTLELMTDNRYAAVGETNRIGASGCWYDPIMWQAFDIAGENKITTGMDLVRTLNSGKDFNDDKRSVIYLENHDHSTLTEHCGGRNFWWKTQPLAIALFTMSGAPFIHNGQEFGEQYWMPQDGNGRVMPRPLKWGKSTDEIGGKLHWLYKKLIQIRKDNPVLSSLNFYPDPYDASLSTFNNQGYGVDTSRGLAIFHRWGSDENSLLQRYMIVLNFSDDNQAVDIPFSVNGNWKDLLNENQINVDAFSFKNYLITSHWGSIFKSEV